MHWRRLDGQEPILLIRAGVKFVDGKRVKREDEAKKAEKKGGRSPLDHEAIHNSWTIGIVDRLRGLA